MSHRETLIELTEHVGERETWEAAVSDIHQALQIVGVVLDELEGRVRALESDPAVAKRSESAPPS